MLLAVVQPKPGPGVLGAAEHLALSASTLESAWKAQSQPRRTDDLRPFDLRLDRVWGVVSSSLQRYSIFHADDSDRASAEALHQRLFPNGLQFLRLPYAEQHAESQRLVDLIDEEELRDELVRLVGEVFVDELVAAHAAYGEALGITKPARTSAPAPAVSVVEPLRALADAVSAYVIQILAFAGVDREKNTEPARLALEPIDRLRRTAARRNSGVPTPTDLEPEDVELPEGFPAPDAEIPAIATA